jgi:osmoprotectant transport system permease protein
MTNFEPQNFEPPRHQGTKGLGALGALVSWWFALLVLLLFWLLATPYLSPIYAALFPGTEPPVYQGDSLFDLFLWHALVVIVASAAAIALGVGGGVFVTRPAGRDFRANFNAIATIGQTFPPVALLAIAVPAIGYGFWPTFIALALYGILPILANTIAGIEAVSPAAREAARGMGLSPAQILRQVELPLALPVILAGVRVSVIINIGTAALGSTVGADTLGTPIIDGLVVDKLAYVIQGGVAVALMAIVTDLGFERLQRCATRYQSTAH